MVNWVLTQGMQNLRDQINAAFPNRDHTSDGTIGDYAHTQEKSGHNPDDTSAHNAEWDGDPDNVPEVRAIDIDSNLGDGVSAQTLVDHIVSLKPSSVLRYVIYNRRIWEAGNDWNSRTYTGASAHTEHIHFSGAYTQASDNNSSFNYRLEDIPMALTSDDKAWINSLISGLRTEINQVADEVWNHQEPNPFYQWDADPAPSPEKGVNAETRRTGGDIRMLAYRLYNMEQRLNTLIDSMKA